MECLPTRHCDCETVQFNVLWADLNKPHSAAIHVMPERSVRIVTNVVVGKANGFDPI